MLHHGELEEEARDDAGEDRGDARYDRADGEGNREVMCNG